MSNSFKGRRSLPDPKADDCPKVELAPWEPPNIDEPPEPPFAMFLFNYSEGR